MNPSRTSVVLCCVIFTDFVVIRPPESMARPASNFRPFTVSVSVFCTIRVPRIIMLIRAYSILTVSPVLASISSSLSPKKNLRMMILISSVSTSSCPRTRVRKPAALSFSALSSAVFFSLYAATIRGPFPGTRTRTSAS